MLRRNKVRKRFDSIKKIGGRTVSDRMGSPHGGDILRLEKISE